MTRSASLPSLDRVVFFDMETEGLDPFKHKIVTIQVREKGKTTIWKIWELQEAGCIRIFFDFLNRIYRKETTFVGYNVLKFDVSFLDQRLRELNMMDAWHWRIIHDYLHWFDLYQFLGNAYYRARHWYSSLAGMQQDTINSHIPALYAKGDYEKIVQYIESEMLSMESVYQGVQKEPFYAELIRLRKKVGTEE